MEHSLESQLYIDTQLEILLRSFILTAHGAETSSSETKHLASTSHASPDPQSIIEL